MRYLIILFTLSVFYNCDPMNTADSGECDQSIEINGMKYTDATSDEFAINDVSLSGDCLVINYSGSGCDGDSWELELFDSGEVAESEPLQRFIRLVLNDDEDCEAYITKEISFNISSLKDGNEVFILNIQDYDATILYE